MLAVGEKIQQPVGQRVAVRRILRELPDGRGVIRAAFISVSVQHQLRFVLAEVGEARVEGRRERAERAVVQRLGQLHDVPPVLAERLQQSRALLELPGEVAETPRLLGDSVLGWHQNRHRGGAVGVRTQESHPVRFLLVQSRSGVARRVLHLLEHLVGRQVVDESFVGRLRVEFRLHPLPTFALLLMRVVLVEGGRKGRLIGGVHAVRLVVMFHLDGRVEAEFLGR